jgi:hypothetical protein
MKREWKARRKKTVEQRFWKHVYKTNGCWFWIGDRTPKGYGLFYCGLTPDGKCKIVYAHRFSYGLAFGSLGSFQCLHSCDIPQCVKPDHLFKGTMGDNKSDYFSKGNKVSGNRYRRFNLELE